MHRVIRDRSNANIGGVAEHRDVRDKKQQRKLKPASLEPVIGEEADGQYSRAFKMQERSRGNGVHELQPTRLADRTLMNAQTQRTPWRSAIASETSARKVSMEAWNRIAPSCPSTSDTDYFLNPTK